MSITANLYCHISPLFKTNVLHICVNTRQRIPKGQPKMDNAEKRAAQATQDEEKQLHTTVKLMFGHRWEQSSYRSLKSKKMTRSLQEIIMLTCISAQQVSHIVYVREYNLYV